jgi:hypothetical protein
MSTSLTSVLYIGPVGKFLPGKMQLPHKNDTHKSEHSCNKNMHINTTTHFGVAAAYRPQPGTCISIPATGGFIVLILQISFDIAEIQIKF